MNTPIEKQAAAASSDSPGVAGNAIAWPDIMEILQSVNGIDDGISRADDPELISAATLHGLMLISQAYSINVATSAERPRFVSRWGDWRHLALGNCPDTTYTYTALDPKGVYRIWGRRNSIYMVDLQIGESFYGTEDGGRNISLVSIDLNDVPTARDGQFEFILGGEKPADAAVNWYAMPPTARTITGRQVANDWLTEKEAELHIERLDPVSNRAPTAQELGEQARAIAIFAAKLAHHPYGVKFHAGLKKRGMVNGGVELSPFSDAGGLANQYYFFGLFDLADDEALIVEIDVPLPCRYWNIQLSDEQNASLDYIYHQSSLNGNQWRVDADGRFRAVICHRDPGVANWLDTGGVQSGVFMGRMKDAAKAPGVPTAKKVPLAKVADHLPADTAFIGSEQRSRIVRARRDAMLARLGF